MIFKYNISQLAEYGVAILAAPVFCLVYLYIYDLKNEDIFWLFYDIKSFLFLIILYPTIEEVTFRGVIQEYLFSKLDNKYSFYIFSLSNILTSLIFVLIHFIHHNPIWATLVFFPSLIFGYFKEKSNSIVPSIMLHMFYNFTFFSFIGN